MGKQPVDPFSGRMLWLLYAAGLMVLLSLCLTAAATGTGWSWPIFLIGLVVGAVMLALNDAMLRLAWRRIVEHAQPADDRLARGREELQKRRRIYPMLFTMAVGVAVFSSAVESYWPVVLLLVFWLLVSVVLPLVLLPSIIRRSERTAPQP